MRLEGSIAQFLLNDKIRSKLKSVIEPWMFETEVYRAFSMVLLKEAFNKPEIDFNILKLVIKDNYSSLRESDFNEIDRLIDTFNEVNEDEINIVINIISEFVKKKTYTKGLQYIAEDNVELADKYITRASNLNLKEREYTKLSNKKKLVDLLERKFPKDGKYIKSSFGLINNNSTFKGYRRGDLVQVVSPTGRGKTSMMCQEAATLAHQGFNIGYAIIGDNEEDDVALKTCSYYSKMPLWEVVEDFNSYIDEYNGYLDNITSITYPMYSISVKELLSDFKHVKEREGLDVLFVDYDQNIASAHESMYESGGAIYGALKAFAQVEDCVVIVASQPKISAWNQELIGVEAANESSKKQANIDMMVTFNWNQECNKVGIMHLAKIRRGNTGVTSKIKFNLHVSELKEITQQEYDYIKDNNEKKVEFTDKELAFED
ncbi:MAG: hypothetical protein HKO92_02200 [Flavobacteriaceae bacterium]|nr:hypothetical protein [Flavobacteriaceae bacterium]